MRRVLYKKRRKQIGCLLQHERKCKKLDQNFVARMMNARQEDISKIEAGSRRIDILELIDYAEALGFSITEIAWRIETYFSALGLLPLPNKNVLEKKILVEVSWRQNSFFALLRDVLPGTFAFITESFDKLQLEIKKGIDSQIKRMYADGNKVPSCLIKKEYVLEYKFLDARSLLKAYSPYISLATISRVSGINQNQLSQYANGLKKARPNQMKRILKAIRKIGRELTAVVV